METHLPLLLPNTTLQVSLCAHMSVSVFVCVNVHLFFCVCVHPCKAFYIQSQCCYYLVCVMFHHYKRCE